MRRGGLGATTTIRTLESCFHELRARGAGAAAVRAVRKPRPGDRLRARAPGLSFPGGASRQGGARPALCIVFRAGEGGEGGERANRGATPRRPRPEQSTHARRPLPPPLTGSRRPRTSHLACTRRHSAPNLPPYPRCRPAPRRPRPATACCPCPRRKPSCWRRWWRLGPRRCQRRPRSAACSPRPSSRRARSRHSRHPSRTGTRCGQGTARACFLSRSTRWPVLSPLRCPPPRSPTSPRARRCPPARTRWCRWRTRGWWTGGGRRAPRRDFGGRPVPRRRRARARVRRRPR